MAGKEIISGDNSSGQLDFETSSVTDVNKQTAIDIDDVGEPENAVSSENVPEQVYPFFMLNSQS